MSAEALHCLVVRQPWAWAIISCAKDIENRSWTTDYRGPLIIQAGAAKTDVNRMVKTGGSAVPRINFAYGSLIGVVDLIGVAPLSEDLEKNPWASGPYCWQLENPRCFAEPIPAKGKLKLFTLPPSLTPDVRAAVASAREVKADAAASAWVDFMTRTTKEARHWQLFYNYIDLNDAFNLMRMAEKAVAENGNSQAFTDRALAQCLSANNEVALADVCHAIDLDPLNSRAFRVRSIIYRALGKAKLAKADERRADELPEAS